MVMVVMWVWCEFVFFFKQKTAYEIYYGLVGSEMCIRDSLKACEKILREMPDSAMAYQAMGRCYLAMGDLTNTCLLYTSDAADELLCVNLGGCRLIKKKKNTDKKQKHPQLLYTYTSTLYHATHIEPATSR